MKRQPIRVGDGFRMGNGEVWTVTEVGLFGRPYWMISADRCKQGLMHRRELDTKERVQGIKLNLNGD